MRRRLIPKIIVIAILIYLILLFLLIAVENMGGSVQGEGITDFGEAAWYLLATLTTVGYGDVTPITGVGKMIGALIMVSSAGVLTFLLGLMFSLFFGRLLPRFRLWRYRRKRWYLFTSLDERTQLLAKEIALEDHEAAYVFLGGENAVINDIFPELERVVIIDLPPEAVVAMQEPSSRISVFCMSQDGWDNYDKAWKLLQNAGRGNLHVFCETEHTPEQLPANMTVFNSMDITARGYWLQYPLRAEEQAIVLVGDGSLACRMLERGLLINVFPADHPVEYHVFGNWENFRRDHFMLGKAVSVNEKKTDCDSIFFHSEEWNASFELLGKASRIILCEDDENVNLSTLAELNRYFPVEGKIFVCAGIHETTGAVFFGSDANIITRRNVIQGQLNRLAILINKSYCQKSGGGSSWEMLSEFQRQSNIAAADHLLTKVRLLLPEENPEQISPEICKRAYEKYRILTGEQKEACRRLEHNRWMRFHFLNNWQYATVRNNNIRHHNLLVPYEKLAEAEQKLGDSAWEILNEVN